MPLIFFLLSLKNFIVLIIFFISEWDNAPNPVGPYSQAVMVDKTLYISGQVAINPENNELIIGSIEAESKQIMKNIKSILNQAGYDFNNVVRSKIYLTDMNNFSKVNNIYGSYFQKNQFRSMQMCSEVSKYILRMK